LRLLEKKKVPTITSLSSFLSEKRASLSREKLVKSIENLLPNSQELLFVATALLQLDGKKGPLEEFLVSSNIFFMRDFIGNKENLTFGADPEFILCDATNPEQTVLLSSKHLLPKYVRGITMPNQQFYTLSELAVGADYGLLEIRPPYSSEPSVLVKTMDALLTAFEETQQNLVEENKKIEDALKKGKDVKQITAALTIQEKEAVEFNHKRSRLLDIIENGELDFGIGTRQKGGGVVASVSGSADLGLTAAELYGISISAYDEPIFTQGNDVLLTAGGHLHFGGRFIKMRSLPQLKALVQKFDKELLPIAAKVETPAAKLRRAVYGSLGEFRLKDYGIEYRTLSNAVFWKKNIKVLQNILNKAEEIIKDFPNP
jgi:hypothetical protein